MAAARRWLGWWVALLAVWGLLVATVDPLEWVAGALAAALAAAVATVVQRRGLVRFHPATHWLADLWRLPWQALRDTGRLALVLWRRLARGEQPAGRFHVVDWPASQNEARDAARRTLVVAAVSLGSNTYVADVDPEHGTVLLHQLVPGDDPLIPPSLLGPP